MDNSWVVHDENNIKGFRNEYSWLSNMHECQILLDGRFYNSVETAYQSLKCANDSDRIKFENITGKEAKKLILTLKTRSKWDSIKSYYMAELVFYKFLYHKDLRILLLETGDKYIEETNIWNDTYWGVYNGEGKNTLGKILMATRAYFKNLKQ